MRSLLLAMANERKKSSFHNQLCGSCSCVSLLFSILNKKKHGFVFIFCVSLLLVFYCLWKEKMIIVVYNFDNDQYTHISTLSCLATQPYYWIIMGFSSTSKSKLFLINIIFDFVVFGWRKWRKNEHFFPPSISNKNQRQKLVSDRAENLIHGIAKQSIINWISINFFSLSFARSLHLT